MLGREAPMPQIKFTVNDPLGNSVEQYVPDDSLVYDSQGNATVDPNTLGVGDMLCAFNGWPPMEITAKEVV
jgi:hypothetical protein